MSRFKAELPITAAFITAVSALPLLAQADQAEPDLHDTYMQLAHNSCQAEFMTKMTGLISCKNALIIAYEPVLHAHRTINADVPKDNSGTLHAACASALNRSDEEKHFEDVTQRIISEGYVEEDFKIDVFVDSRFSAAPVTEDEILQYALVNYKKMDCMKKMNAYLEEVDVHDYGDVYTNYSSVLSTAIDAMTNE